MIRRIHVGVWSISACLAVASGTAARLDAQSPPEHLTLKEAQQRAVDGHPQVAAGRSAALAASEVVREAKSAYWPTVYGSVTGAAAQDGTRITAGVLNNPTVFDRDTFYFDILIELDAVSAGVRGQRVTESAIVHLPVVAEQ